MKAARVHKMAKQPGKWAVQSEMKRARNCWIQTYLIIRILLSSLALQIDPDLFSGDQEVVVTALAANPVVNATQRALVGDREGAEYV